MERPTTKSLPESHLRLSGETHLVLKELSISIKEFVSLSYLVFVTGYKQRKKNKPDYSSISDNLSFNSTRAIITDSKLHLLLHNRLLKYGEKKDKSIWKFYIVQT